MSAHPLAGITIPGRVTSAAPKPKPKGLYGTAKAQAQSDTDAAIAAIRLAQAQANQQAQARANQLRNASLADANLLRGIAGQTQASYTQGANQLANLAQGYSGELRGVASAEAEKTLQGLNAPTGGVTGQLGALSNVLYGLGGAIPANVLLTTGLAQAGAQRQLPATALSQGAQYAQGALAQGQQQSQNLQTQIQQAIASQPQLVQSYLAQLQKAKQDQLQQQSDDYYRQQQLAIDQYNAQTSRYSATKPSSSAGGSPGGTGALAGLTPNAANDLIQGWYQTASDAAHGTAGSQRKTGYTTIPNPDGSGSTTVYTYAPVPGSKGKNYGQVVRLLIQNRATPAQARAIADQFFAPGQSGRPRSPRQIAQQRYFTQMTVSTARGLIAQAIKSGATYADAVAALIQSGVPEGVANQAGYVTPGLRTGAHGG